MISLGDIIRRNTTNSSCTDYFKGCAPIESREKAVMEKLEIEVKFFLPPGHSMREDILDLGARSRGRFFEKNIRFDFAEIRRNGFGELFQQFPQRHN